MSAIRMHEPKAFATESTMFMSILANQSSDLKSILDAMKTPAQMSDAELLKQYSPTASSNIIDELKQRSNDRAFIVFDEAKGNDVVDVETSLKLLRIARRQETPATYKVGTKLCRVHRLGEFPMVFVEAVILGDKIRACGRVIEVTS